ncbi:MAG: PilZ domain-containing protein [Candidatus Omnitrophica bacterium]|nr:PilZ domain-containing protein [Candidatus Omnitrophota bacterium]
METHTHVEDKRRFKRIDTSLPLQYRNLRKIGDNPIDSSAKNISEGGVCFKSKEFISLACRMVVEITVPNSGKPIKAITKVAWIRRIPNSEHYELGNQFLDMTKEDKVHISNFVKQITPSA